eukprot:gnl/MRDRNA2_/MRDRNA2_164192_c0_seq1.p1 gnl/MRDRNA2_/MRDRNA2_164192_c0~~gnl/MRDRNA2_/MRDRNA2_164192_c0_seq1.p1  ORF type:complete len:271 (+),score=40.72 gnl/MRDRNA2_/MRDRNA2_164192_c0_seq1:24-815(+)
MAAQELLGQALLDFEKWPKEPETPMGFELAPMKDWLATWEARVSWITQRLQDPELKESNGASKLPKKVAFLQTIRRTKDQTFKRVHMDASTNNGVQGFGVPVLRLAANRGWSALEILRSSVLNVWVPTGSPNKRLFLLNTPEVEQLMKQNGWAKDAEGEQRPWIAFVEQPSSGPYANHRVIPMLTTYGREIAEYAGAISCEGSVVLFLSDALMHAGAGYGSSAEFRFLVDFRDGNPSSEAESMAAAEFYARDLQLTYKSGGKV